MACKTRINVSTSASPHGKLGNILALLLLAYYYRVITGAAITTVDYQHSQKRIIAGNLGFVCTNV